MILVGDKNLGVIGASMLFKAMREDEISERVNIQRRVK